MNTDSYFTRGSGHDVCEDYAYSGTTKDGHPFAIISDGCSGSDNTDIGARLIVHAIKDIINQYPPVDPQVDYRTIMDSWLKVKIENIRTNLSLHHSCFDATIRLVILCDDVLHMYTYGDGITILKNQTTGETDRYVRQDVTSNAPYYFSYKMIPGATDAYLKKFPDALANVGLASISVRDYIDMPNTFYTHMNVSGLSPGTYTCSVMSDGMETFFGDDDKLGLDPVLDEMLAFKNVDGECDFVKRRVKKYLKQCAKKNIRHYDDISMASISFEVKGNDDDVHDD